MTRKEALRQAQQIDILRSLGFTTAEAESLRRISMTLHRWHELKCRAYSACIVRGRLIDGAFTYDDNGRPYVEYVGPSGLTARYAPLADRERGALRRLRAILQRRNGVSQTLLTYYIQTHQRGAALYILRPGDVPDGADAAAYYTRGVCVY